MLVVTARLFKDNQLVGYRLSDGQSTQDFTKQQAWTYAKNKQIANVVATGTEQEPGLSGVNGFELKSLEQIKWSDKTPSNSESKCYNTQDLLSSGIRLRLNGAVVTADSNIASMYKQNLREEAQSGKVNTVMIRSMSNYFKVVNTLADPTQKGGSIAVAIPTGEQLEKQKQAWLEDKNKHIRLAQYLIEVSNRLLNTANELVNQGYIEIKAGELVSKVDVRALKAVTPEYMTAELKELLDQFKGIGTTEPNEIVNLQDYIKAFTEIAPLLDEFLEKIRNVEFTPKRALTSTSPIIGYRIEYTGNEPIETFRITATDDHTMVPFTINPGQTVCLNRAELAILGSKPEVGCTFANGKLEASSKRAFDNNYKFLNSNYFAFTAKVNGNRIQENGSDIKRPVTDFVSGDDLGIYFIPSMLTQSVQSTHQQESIKKLQSSKKAIDIFNAFKR